MEDKMRDDRMSEREVDEAIRVTEEKLRLLKGVVDRRKAATAAGGGVYAGGSGSQGSPSQATPDGSGQQVVLEVK